MQSCSRVPDVEELDTSEDRQFIPSKKTRDDIGLPEQNPGLLDASKLSENAGEYN